MRFAVGSHSKVLGPSAKYGFTDRTIAGCIGPRVGHSLERGKIVE